MASLIGNKPNQVPTNADLGTLAYEDAANIAGPIGLGGDVSLLNGTANGVAYLNGSKVLTSGSGLVFNGTNLGLGVTPSAWGSSFKALQVAGGAGLMGTSNGAWLAGNCYFDNTNWRYVTTNNATMLNMAANGTFNFYNAPSGTAGNAITFTQAMTLDASGNLLVGLTSATGVAKLQVSGPLRTTGYTVATLPTGTVGMRTYVTDALAPAALAPIVGGGSVTVPVFYNGANWIAG